MPDVIAQGAEWLTDQRKSHLSRDVAYVVDGVSTTVAASIGRTEFEVQGDGGAISAFESRDFIVAAADMPGEPERGARIHETQGATVFIFEVMAPVQSSPPWRWADAARTSYRIHTKLVGTL